MSINFPTQFEHRTAYYSFEEHIRQAIWVLLALLNSNVIPIVLEVMLKGGNTSLGVNFPSSFLTP